MYVICPYPRYRMNVRSEVKDRDERGMEYVKKPRLYVQFMHGGHCPDWAKQMALQKFQWRGLPYAQDPLTRLGWWDDAIVQREHGWSDEDMDILRETLIKNEDRHPYMIVEAPGMEPPWPAYDELKVQGRRNKSVVTEKVLEGISVTGVDRDYVVAYEKANLNRDWLIEAVENFRPIVEDEVEVVEA